MYKISNKNYKLLKNPESEEFFEIFLKLELQLKLDLNPKHSKYLKPQP